MNHLRFAIFATLVALATGCVSQSLKTGLQEGFAGVVVKAFEPGLVLAQAANEFRTANKRWPKDYLELSSFLKVVDRKSFDILESAHYDHIEFCETPEGLLEVNSAFSIMNQDYSLPSGGAVRINDLKVSVTSQIISPFDPGHE